MKISSIFFDENYVKMKMMKNDENDENSVDFLMKKT